MLTYADGIRAYVSIRQQLLGRSECRELVARLFYCGGAIVSLDCLYLSSECRELMARLLL
jgi:hypothetical protein